MPEGPELFLASRYINGACGGLVFSGKVEKSAVSRSPEVPFESDAYAVAAASRGKELRLSLTPLPPAGKGARRPREKAAPGALQLVFRFGMSGAFRLVPAAQMPKHAHLRFFTREAPPRALCFVDARRFGGWTVGGGWRPGRGPCVMLEYREFRQNVLRNLSDKAFDKPICEALLNQRFFNGIGNYLRAEILYRLRIPPFEKARSVLENLQFREQASDLTLSKKVKLKREDPDLLELCHRVPMEVVSLGGKGYDPDHPVDYAAFKEWLQCYAVPGMKSLRDANGRTVWFQGDPGAMAPKDERPDLYVCVQLRKRRRLPSCWGNPRRKGGRRKSGRGPASPKVPKQAAESGSKAIDPPKAAKGTRKPRRKESGKTGQELVDGAAAKGAGAPGPQARRTRSASRAARPTSSPAAVPRRRASARKTRGEKGLLR